MNGLHPPCVASASETCAITVPSAGIHIGKLLFAANELRHRCNFGLTSLEPRDPAAILTGCMGEAIRVSSDQLALVSIYRLERVPPWRHFDAIIVAGSPRDKTEYAGRGAGRAICWLLTGRTSVGSPALLTISSANSNHVQSPPLVTCTIPLAFFRHNCDDRSCQVDRIGRTSALIIDHIERRTGRRQLQNRIGKAFPAHPKEPRGSDDAAIGQCISSNRTSASAFASSVDTLRISRVARFRTEISFSRRTRNPNSEKASCALCGFRRFGDVHRAVAIHRKSQLAIALASIDIGVRRGKNDPVRASLLARPACTRAASRMSASRELSAGYCIAAPLAHEGSCPEGRWRQESLLAWMDSAAIEGFGIAQ